LFSLSFVLTFLSSNLMMRVSSCNSNSATESLDSIHPKKLRHVKRAEEEISQGFLVRLPYIREAAILTLRNYGCQFDENDQEFKDYLETSFGKVAGSLGPNEKVTTAAKRIVALVVTSYGCAGHVRHTDPAFFLNYGAVAISRGDLEINKDSIRRASALTMQTYGCKVDSEDEEFSAKFDIAFDAIKNKLNSIEARRTVPKVFLLSSTRKIVTKVVADWGCVGFLAPNDPVFNDRFQAAYAVEVLRLKDIGNERANAAKFLEEYGCGQVDPTSKEFVEKYLSTFTETVVERRGDEDIYYLGSIQGDKLLAKYGCVPSHNRHLNNNSK